MKRRWLIVMAILAMLLGLLLGIVFTAPLAAQGVEPVPDPELTVNVAVVNDGADVEPVPKGYLPLVVAAGQSSPPPASPYAVALSQALDDCAGTALNQVCYARGSVTLDGGGPLTTPGQLANLDGVSGLTLVSPDADHWSVALLRLAVDSPTPDLGLTLLAFGNVEIRNLILFNTAAGNGDVAPALSFSSSPVPGEDPMTGGLIVYNPTDEEPLSIGLNEADLTLASSAVVQAQPGVNMTVTMAIGSALVQTMSASGTRIFETETVFRVGALIPGHALTVPLDTDGKAAGAPTNPTLIRDNELAAIAAWDKDCRLARMVVREFPSTRDSIAANINAFADAHERCLQGNSRQVYRIMYYGRLLRGYNSLYPNILTDRRMVLVDKMLQQCATFEIEFNSVMTSTNMCATGSMHIQGQGMIVSYGADGSLVQPAKMPLTHLDYKMKFAWPPGTYYVVLDNGKLGLTDGYMRIIRNRLDISTTVSPAGVDEHLFVKELGEIANPVLWDVLWRDLHVFEDVGLGTAYRFTPAHWKYTGNRILAEAIVTNRKVTHCAGEVTGDTWLVMLHKPAR